MKLWRLTFPVLLGYFPVGITFGLLGCQQGLSLFQVMAFSVFVYAGSSQMVALGLLAEGITSPVTFFTTVWLVNLRYVILSLAYLPYLKKWSLLQKLRFLPMVSDETFAVLVGSASTRTDPKQAWGVVLIPYVGWSLFTLIGYFFGSVFPDPRKFGLDFALTALFIGLVVLFLKKWTHAVTLVLAFLLMFLFYFICDFGRGSVILSAVLASFIGALVEWKTSR